LIDCHYWRRKVATSIYRGDARDVAKYSTMYRQPSTTKNFPAQNVSSAERKNSALE